MKTSTPEMVRIDNFVRFSSLYSEVHVEVKGTEPFATGIRRVFNRYNKAAGVDGVTHFSADDLLSAFRKDLSA